MLIDWFTVAAQILNFLVLIALLKRFLYGPITRAMDEREARIASRLREADEKGRKAELEAASYREKMERFDAEREEMLAMAGREADAKRRDLTHKAREEVDGLRERWLDALRCEKESFLTDLRETMCKELCKTARRALADLAGVELERHIATVFAEKICRVDMDGWRNGMRPVRKDGMGVTVRSAFEIPPELRERITDAVQYRLKECTAVEFETSEDLLCGIELCAFDRKIAWNMADYMDGLEGSVSALISEDRSVARSGPSEKDREQER